MKELSIKEKAKAYDEALEKARQLCTYPTSKPFISDLQDLFPELAESEDERIINRIKKAVEEYWSDEPLDEILTWLKKRGEQKPTFEMKTPEESLGVDSDTYNKIVDECIYGEQKPAWSEEDEYCLDGAIETEKYMLDVVNGVKEFSVGNISIKEECTRELNWLKSLKGRVQPQQDWSEEDENRINRLIAYFEDKESFTAEDDIVYANWLKSLRPQSTWKPSEEQIRELSIVATGKGWFSKEILRELLEQLKKLRKE